TRDQRHQQGPPRRNGRADVHAAGVPRFAPALLPRDVAGAAARMLFVWRGHSVSESRKHRRRTRRRGRASIRNSTTNPDTIRRAEQMAQACRLRSRGFSYRQIARAMKIGVMTAHDLVMDAISAVVQERPQERIEMERALQLDRLDALQPAIYRRAVRGDPA